MTNAHANAVKVLLAALERIVAYENAEWILENGENEWGLPGRECLEMAYDNLQAEAKAALQALTEKPPA